MKLKSMTPKMQIHAAMDHIALAQQQMEDMQNNCNADFTLGMLHSAWRLLEEAIQTEWEQR